MANVSQRCEWHIRFSASQFVALAIHTTTIELIRAVNIILTWVAASAVIIV